MIIDFHIHVFPPEMIEKRGDYFAADSWFAELYRDSAAKMATAEEAVAEMDRCGIDVAVISGFAFNGLEACAACNSYVAEAGARFPQRLVGFGVVPPLDPGAGAELERCLGLGLRGIGELMPDGQGFGLEDAVALSPLTGFAREHGLPLLIHMSEPVGHEYPGKGRTTPRFGYSFARANPDLTIIFAHWGGGLPFYELMPEVSRELRNVYYDCAASPWLFDSRIFPAVIASVGASKILLGSDFPLISPERYIEQIGALGLPADETEAILGGNAARLLGLRP